MMQYTQTYAEFLAAKVLAPDLAGFAVAPADLPAFLKPWQALLVAQALQRGRSALFAECGMGKTPMQLAWLDYICRATGSTGLILAPLAVVEQTVGEGVKFGITVHACERQSDVVAGAINITNYEKLHLFTPDSFIAVVLDESSVLKNYVAKTKQALLLAFAATPYKLCCTATPAPNDTTELGNHSEFLGVMESGDMLTNWFIRDSKNANNLRLRHHADTAFWQWVTSWAACVSKPSDLLDPAGVPYSDEGYALPGRRLVEHAVAVDYSITDGTHLMRMPTLSATEVHKEHRATAADRAAKAVELVRAEPDEYWILWCHTNYEADEVRKLLPEAVEVRGSDSATHKKAALLAFTRGEIKYLISKPEIAGFGLNWPHCARVVFVGQSYSFEQEYQALRRTYRFGQTREVHAHIIVPETEGAVALVVERKRRDHAAMQQKMVAAMRATQGAGPTTARADIGPALINVARGDGYTMYHGDCVEVIDELADDSVDLTVSSLPFSDLYTYSASLRDMGNCHGDDHFFQHFSYLVPKLYRVTKAGRLCVMHCKNLPMYKSRYGVTGLRDFRGDVIRAFTEAEQADGGQWVLHSEVTIWTDPVDERARTNNQRLLYKQLLKDSSLSGQGQAEFLVVFRKWTPTGESAEPISHTTETAPLAVWQRWASPVWFDIRRTDVLNGDIARSDPDEKHICPLQLTICRRAIKLWSNPGDLVLDPFMGIGSVGVEALKAGRKTVGIDQKREYFEWAVRHLDKAVTLRKSPNFLHLVDEDDEQHLPAALFGHPVALDEVAV